MELLSQVGERVRHARQARGYTQAELARRAGVSTRFLVDLEGGTANISLLRLAEVAVPLGVSLTSLVAGLGAVRDDVDELAAVDPVRRSELLRHARSVRKVALVGLRGAGKSTIGRRLAPALTGVLGRTTFVEVDAEVEAEAGMRLGEIFEYHGAPRYRELERLVLERLIARPDPLVIATGGSLVTASDTWQWLQRSACTVWLKASSASHLARVQAQGDLRPMRGHADALADLRGILGAREPLYAQAALTVDTETLDVAAAVERIVAFVGR